MIQLLDIFPTAEALLRWTGGFFDGEGSINIAPSTLQLGVTVANTVPLAIDIFETNWGGNRNTVLKKGDPTAVRYFARKDGELLAFNKMSDQKHFLTDIYPYLVIKQRQAALALTFLERVASFRTLRTSHHGGRAGGHITAIEREYRGEVCRQMKALNDGLVPDEPVGIEILLPKLL